VVRSDGASEIQGQHLTPWKVLKESLKRITPFRAVIRGTRTVLSDLMHVVESGLLVRKLDHVIITGGGALDELWGGAWGHPWVLFKFAMICKFFRVPFLFVSVGKCSLERPLSRFFVRKALCIAQYRSYRDHESKKAIQAIFASPLDPVYPDLAYGYQYAAQLNSIRNRAGKGRFLVAVSPIAYFAPDLWPLADEERYQRYLHELAELIRWLISQSHDILLFATDSPDVDAIKDLLTILSANPVETRSIRVLSGPPDQTAECLLEELRYADIVIASRLHGVILAHLLTIPVLAISYDHKVDVHMSEIEQAKHCVNINNFDVTTLISGFSTLSAVLDVESAHLRRAVQINREQVNVQYDLLFGERCPSVASEKPLEHAVLSVPS
jgi:polysaccharide pyruvyl transferase WcaK-like protein